jgi:glycosyltransferase involved in cell wall biosynthesis
MPADSVADVCLMVEGTYPYVLGGVSAWVDQIIRGLPDITFALFFVGSTREAVKHRVYQLPANVVDIRELFLHERLPEAELLPARGSGRLRSLLYKQARQFYLADSVEEKCREFWPFLDVLGRNEGRFTYGNFLRDREAWELMEEACDKFARGESFIDFFWTVRFLHLPIWRLWQGRESVPAAKVYHSICTGYTGLLGAMTARKYGAPFLITEHGIYTKERIAEISRAEWIYEGESEVFSANEGLGQLKQMWVGLFMLLGRLAYGAADRVITLYEGNALVQIEFGADARKIHVIPNGIEPEQFNAVHAQASARWQAEPATKTVGFIGRVVPIKDVKTLLRAARLVCDECPEVKFQIIGPYDEDPAYYNDCVKALRLLDLADKVRFTGPQKLMDVLPQIDVVVLTSISEGLPLVILEAFAAGIPVVATDVGACRELVFGRGIADKSLGRAGRLTKILAPEETARALVAILRNPSLWRQLSGAARARVENYYSMSKLLQSYRELYQTLAAAKPRQAAAAPV